MLVLTMKIGDKIDIGSDITICYTKKKEKDQILVGFEAPENVQIIRQNAKCKTKKGKT